MGTVTKVKKGQVLDYKYTGGVQSVTLPVGTYRLEVWGAEGGTAINNYGGYGGYSVGTLTLTDESTVLYIQVGGYPASVGDDRVVVPGGYNGGGNGYNRYYNDTATYGQGGGGGTDIRIGQDSLYARVIVAGGGGGSASNGNERAKKYGGGLDGGCEASAYQAHQTPSTGSTNVNFGTFGQGGAATTEGGNYKYGSGGGGGGWYGGAASNRYSDSETTLRTYNGGGSGYVYTADTATNYPSGCLLNSSYYLAEAQTIAGNTSFPSPNGGTETGHEGNGYARITVLAVESSISASVKVGGQWHQANEMFVKVNGVWKECVEAWMKVNGVWKSLAESTPSTSATYTITLGANVGKITANGEIPQRDKLSYHVSKGDTIVVTSTTFNANSYTMVFSHTPANVSFSKKTNNGTGTRATTSVTFTMPASDLTVGFTLKSGAGA
nr:MAG TPA: Glycine rich protein [Caudoviricetes sp.]